MSKAIVSHKAKWRIMVRDGFSCIYCGQSPLTHRGVELTLDHVVPLAAGGSDLPHNIVIACRQCNTSKGSAVLHQSFASQIHEAIAKRNKSFNIAHDYKIYLGYE